MWAQRAACCRPTRSKMVSCFCEPQAAESGMGPQEAFLSLTSNVAVHAWATIQVSSMREQRRLAGAGDLTPVKPWGCVEHAGTWSAGAAVSRRCWNQHLVLRDPPTSLKCGVKLCQEPPVS